MTTLNLFEDPLPSLGSAFTHALASVLNTRDTDHDVAVRANDYINDLQGNPRGVEVMLWLLENFSTITIKDPTYFLFAILNTLSRSLMNAKSSSSQNSSGGDGYCRSWLNVMRSAKSLIDNGLFGPGERYSDAEKASLRIVAETIMATPYISAKLHQVIGILYVAFSPGEWTYLNKFIMDFFQHKAVPSSVVFLLAGSVLELCMNLNAESASSQFAQRKIDKKTRLDRVKEMPDLIALILRIPTALRSDNPQMANQVHSTVTKLLAEFSSLLVSVQMPSLLETPTQFSFKLWTNPEILENTNTVLSTTQDLVDIVRTICSGKIRKETFYDRLSSSYQLELMEQAVSTLKMILDSTISAGIDWNDSDMFNIIHRIMISLNYIVSKCRNRNWRSHLNTMYIVLVGLHIPESQIFIRAIETLAVLVGEENAHSSKPEMNKSNVGPIIIRTGSSDVKSNELSANQSNMVDPLYHLAYKTIVYRLIRPTDRSMTTDPSDAHQTFLDSAVAQLIRSNLENHLGVHAPNFSDITTWKEHVIDATLAADDSGDDIRLLLSSQACAVRNSFKGLARNLVNAGGSHWQLFAACLLSCIDEWTSNEAFKSSLTHTYAIPNTLSTKLRGFISPCYTIIDAIGQVLYALSELNNPVAAQLGEQILTAIVQFPLTWIDTKVKLNTQEFKVDIELVSNPKTTLGSHWHWLEWRRLEIIKQCSSLILANREAVILPHLLTRIYLDTPDTWLSDFPTGEVDNDEDDIFYLTRRKACGSIASAYTQCATGDMDIARPQIESVINILVARMSHSARPLSASEHHVLIESIIGLTSALNNCELSKRALSLMITQTFTECKNILEAVNLSGDALRKAFFSSDVAACCERRRQLCRQLFCLDTITTSLCLPNTIQRCINGGFIRNADPSVVASHRQTVTNLFPLRNESSSEYAELFLSYNAPQELYALNLMPLLLSLFSRIIELHATRCQGPCNCGYPLCCAALTGIAEDDLNTVQCVTKKSLSLDDLWQMARPNVGAPSSEVAAFQSNIRNLAQVTTKLISSLLKVCSSLALYNYQAGNSQCLLTIEYFMDLGRRTVNQWLQAPGIPTSLHTLIVDRVLRQGLLYAFEASNLPSNCTELIPIQPDPFTLVMPTPDSISFHMAMCELVVVNVCPVLYQLCCQCWQSACDVARSGGEFQIELVRTQAAQLLSATSQLLSLSFTNTQSQVSSKKDGTNDDDDVLGPGAMISELSKCTTSSLRAMNHVHLLRELFTRPNLLEGLLQQAVQMLSFPIGEVQTAAHHIIRSYARLTWKRISNSVVGSGLENLTEFLNTHSKLLESLYDNVIDIALIIKANPPIKDDPYAADVVLDIPADHNARLLYESKLPKSLLHHIFSGKSSSSGSQLYAAVKLTGAYSESQEIRWTANEGMSAYALSYVTLYELVKAAVQLFSLRCIHLVLKKSAGYQLNNAELLSSVNFDPIFRKMILKMADNSRFQFTLDPDTLVEWVTLLHHQKECKSVRENIKQFLLGNLKAIFSR